MKFLLCSLLIFFAGTGGTRAEFHCKEMTPKTFGECGDFSDMALEAKDWKNRSLRGSKAQYQGAGFVRIENVNASYSVWKMHRFKGTNINGLNIDFSDIRGSFWDGVIAKRFTAIQSKLMAAKFYFSDLRAVNFRGSDLRYAYFLETNLQNADFRDADLRGAQLVLSNLAKAIYNHSTKLPFSESEAIKLGMIRAD